MEVRPLQAFLRVLYTVNGNPQYILAKSSSQVPVVSCGETVQPTANEPVYARAPLKACLAAVCDSSPELLQDPARDFSLYVLDPLEAQPLPSNSAHSLHNSSSPCGVAVALGLMSWALELADSADIFVTGTITPNTSPVLEVVFALRETRRVPKPTVYSYPSFGTMPALGPPQSPGHPHLPQSGRVSWSSTTYFQHSQHERRTLTRSADFPELYIGPPRRARGRPEGSTSSRSKITSQDNISSQPAASSSKATDTQFESKKEIGRKTKQKTKARPHRAPPTHSPFVRAPLTRYAGTGGPKSGAATTAAVYQQSHTSGQNQPQPNALIHPQTQPYIHSPHNPLLGLLSAVSSIPGNMTANTTPEQQVALLSALQTLLATNPDLLQLAATNAGLSVSGIGHGTETKLMHGERNVDDEHDDGDSDIILLDSSTIDTAAFHKSNSGEVAASHRDRSSLATNEESVTPSSQGIESSPLPASIPPSEQENTPVSFYASTPCTAPESTPTLTPEAKIQTSKQGSLGRTEKITLGALEVPATPTPCRTRKRKLDEYVQGQARSSTPMSPPPPSSCVALTSSSGRARQRVQPVSSPSVRLPSMLGSMRTVTAGSRMQDSSSMHMHPASLATKNGIKTIVLDSGPSNSVTPDATSLKRRCTLSEFMAEHEARKNAKVRKRTSSGRKQEVGMPTTVSRAGPSRSAAMVSTSRHAQSSPPRPLFRSGSVATSSPTSAFQPGLGSGTAASNSDLSSMTTLTRTTPVTFTSAAAPTKNPLKNFVLPAWARTSTAMLPRLSEETLARQRAEQEAKMAQISLRRREAAKAKRKRLRGVEHPSKESSDEGDETVANIPNRRTTHPSSTVARNVPSLVPSLPSLPVFASDAVGSIQSSSPQPHRQLVLPSVPSTPPRKPGSLGLGSHRTPGKSGSYSLFTPSEQDLGSLFTPSTPSVTRSFSRAIFTPHSPTMVHHSGARRSPRKSIARTPRTPKRNSGNHPTPKGLHTGGNSQYVSPSLAVRTLQTQTGMGTRAFLLPPPSPCALRMPELRVHSEVPADSTSIIPEDAVIVKQESLLNKRKAEQDHDRKEENTPSYDPGDPVVGKDRSTPPEQYCSLSRSATNVNDDASRVEDGYASSPLPPSSPLPVSPLSSPEKRHDSDCGTPTIDNLLVPDSDILLPSGGDSDELGATTPWLSDSAASWFTDSGTNAWLTETEAWPTDTEGGPLSDGAWFSDSDAVFGDISSLPPSSAPNWLSDDADVDTDGEGAMEDQNGGFDAAAFEWVFAALVERGGQNASKDESSGGDTTHGARVAGPGRDLWESLQPLLRGNGLNDLGAAPGNVGGSVDEEKAAQELEGLLNGLVDT